MVDFEVINVIILSANFFNVDRHEKKTIVQKHILQIPPDKRSQFIMMHETIIQTTLGAIS